MNKHQQLYKIAGENYDLLVNVAKQYVRSRESAEDVVQNSIIYLLKRIKDHKQKKYKKLEKVNLPIMIKVVRSRSLDWLRQKKNCKVKFIESEKIENSKTKEY